MKILMLADYIENYKCESAYTVRFTTAKKISEKGHEVTLIAPAGRSLTPRAKRHSANFLTISSPAIFPEKFRKGGFGLLDILFKTSHILFNNYDVVHVTSGHRPAQYLPCLFGRVFKGCTIIDEWWEWFGKDGIAGSRKSIIGRLISRYDILTEIPSKGIYHGIIAISSTLKDRLKNKDKAIVLNGGAEVSTLKEYDKKLARQAVGIADNLFVIGLINLCEEDQSDNQVFLDAFSIISKEIDGLRLFVTGAPDYINKFTTDLPYRDKIIYAGWLDFERYNKYLSSCDIFVLPFRNIPRNAGRWPNKIGDFLCLNRPIITNPTGDLKRLFEKYSIGITCEDNIESYTELIADLFYKTLDASSLAKDALMVASEVLSFDKRIDNIMNYYQKLRFENEV